MRKLIAQCQGGVSLRQLINQYLEHPDTQVPSLFALGAMSKAEMTQFLKGVNFIERVESVHGPGSNGLQRAKQLVRSVEKSGLRPKELVVLQSLLVARSRNPGVSGNVRRHRFPGLKQVYSGKVTHTESPEKGHSEIAIRVSPKTLHKLHKKKQLARYFKQMGFVEAIEYQYGKQSSQYNRLVKAIDQVMHFENVSEKSKSDYTDLALLLSHIRDTVPKHKIRRKWYKPTHKVPDYEFELDNISGGQVFQGMIADCYFLNLLILLADQNPDFIRNELITYYPKDKVAMVRFFDAFSPDGRTWIKVDLSTLVTEKMFLKEADLFAGGGPDSHWIRILEKAFTIFKSRQTTGEFPIYKAVEGDSPAANWFYLTGQRGYRIDFEKQCVPSPDFGRYHRTIHRQEWAQLAERWQPVKTVGGLAKILGTSSHQLLTHNWLLLSRKVDGLRGLKKGALSGMSERDLSKIPVTIAELKSLLVSEKMTKVNIHKSSEHMNRNLDQVAQNLGVSVEEIIEHNPVFNLCPKNVPLRDLMLNRADLFEHVSKYDSKTVTHLLFGKTLNQVLKQLELGPETISIETLVSICKLQIQFPNLRTLKIPKDDPNRPDIHPDFKVCQWAYTQIFQAAFSKMPQKIADVNHIQKWKSEFTKIVAQTLQEGKEKGFEWTIPNKRRFVDGLWGQFVDEFSRVCKSIRDSVVPSKPPEKLGATVVYSTSTKSIVPTKGLAPDHSYAVSRLTPNFVEVVNPWGHGGVERTPKGRLKAVGPSNFRFARDRVKKDYTNTKGRVSRLVWPNYILNFGSISVLPMPN